MSAILSGWAAKIFISAIICMIILLLAGDGPHKEAVRLGCACFMVLAVISSVNSMPIDIKPLEEYNDTIEKYVGQALEDAEEEKMGLLQQYIDSYIEEKAEGFGIKCESHAQVEVKGELETVTHITLEIKDGADVEALKSALKSEFNLNDGDIEVRW